MSTILVVDDDVMTLRMVEYALSGGGHEVVSTTTPEDAATLAIAHHVEAVVLDVLMPGRSGYEVLEELHADPRTRNVPVLMLSSLAQSAHRVKGLQKGADEYLGKPFDPEELLLRLNRLLATSRATEPLFEGSLSTVSFPEVVQSLLHGGRTGVLELRHRNQRGEVVIDAGRAVGASWGRLHGRQAILSMIELREGRFNFEERPRDFESTDHGVNLSLQQAIFTGVWLEDEISRWPPVAEDQLLWVIDEGRLLIDALDDYGTLPLLVIWEEVERHPGIAVRELLSRELAAPKVLHLSLCVLVHSGALSSTPPTEDAGTGAAGSPEPGATSLDAAVAALHRSARGRGFSGEVLHSLMVVTPSVHAATLTLRQQVPTSALASSGDSFTAAWRAGRLPSLAFATASGKLVLHVASTQHPQARDRIRERLRDMAGVALWLQDPTAVSGLRWLVDAVAAAAVGQWGLLLASDRPTGAAASVMLEGSERWRLVVAEPASVAEILRLLAAAAER